MLRLQIIAILVAIFLKTCYSELRANDFFLSKKDNHLYSNMSFDVTEVQWMLQDGDHKFELKKISDEEYHVI